VKEVDEVISLLGLEKRPDKTVIGWIERGIGFPGRHIRPAGLAAAQTPSNASSNVPPGFVARSVLSPTAPPGSGGK
jgi:hypothetical protein